MTSFAQNGEDVRLWLFADQSEGFYVDVGAGNPTADSVTRLFYDVGWTGINIEPGPDEFEKRAAPRRQLEWRSRSRRHRVHVDLVAEPRALVARRAVHDPPGGLQLEHKIVRTTARLEEVIAEHAAGTIDFLKVDVEGLERDVLESFDPLAIRPKVVLVEAVSPVTYLPTHGEWEGLILEPIVLAAFDGVNRFYVPVEHDELMPALSYPLSALDHYVRCATGCETGMSASETCATMARTRSSREVAAEARSRDLERWSRRSRGGSRGPCEPSDEQGDRQPRQ